MTKSLRGESLEAATEIIDVVHIEQCLGHHKPLVSIGSYWFFFIIPFSRSLFRSQATSEPAVIKKHVLLMFSAFYIVLYFKEITNQMHSKIPRVSCNKCFSRVCFSSSFHSTGSHCSHFIWAWLVSFPVCYYWSKDGASSHNYSCYF